MEENNLLTFEKNNSQFNIKVARKRKESGDYVGALSVLFDVYNQNRKDIDVIAEIADVYFLMGLYQTSSNFLLKMLINAPESKKAKIIEQLALNSFHRGDFGATKHLIFENFTKGHGISDDLEDEDFLDFLSNLPNRRSKYYLAYPFDKADYSERKEKARRAFLSSMFDYAKDVYEKIPKECLDAESYSIYAMTLFALEDEEKAISILRQAIESLGENVTLYCTLSNLYRMKGDKEKGEYYYKKAKEISTGKEGEESDFLGCAIEYCDYEKSKECLSILLKDRPYDALLNFFYGLTLINLGEFEEGKKAVFLASKIHSEDRSYSFYAEYVVKVLSAKDKDKYLPIEIVKDFPASFRKRYRKTVEKLKPFSEETDKLDKKQDVLDALFWALDSGEEELIKKSAIILCSSNSKKGEDYLKDVLLSPHSNDDVKRFIVYALVICECKGDIYLICGNVPRRIKRRKLIFSSKNNGMEYLSAYGLALSRLIFVHERGADRLAFNANKVYKALNGKVKEGELNVLELAVLMIDACNCSNFYSYPEICEIFKVDMEKLKVYKDIIKGEK